MNIAPTFDLHPEFEFNFAENTDSTGCCCCWKSRAVRPNEFFVSKRGLIEPFKNTTKEVEARIIANERLANLVASKFSEDPIENNEAFDRLRNRVNHDFNGDIITEQTLTAIVNAIYEIKEEINA